MNTAVYPKRCVIEFVDPNMPPPTLRDVAHGLAAAAEHDPRFGWHITPDPLPNGRYLVDHEQAIVYLDGRLGGNEAFVAYIEAIDELVSGLPAGARVGGDNAEVILLHRRLAKERAETEPANGTE